MVNYGISNTILLEIPKFTIKAVINGYLQMSQSHMNYTRIMDK